LRRRHLLLAFALCTALASAAAAAQRFPKPELPEEYVYPTTPSPAPRSDVMEYVDVAVLAAALGLGTYLVLRRRSRGWILGLTIFALLYFGFYRMGCVCPIGAIQHVTSAVFVSEFVLPAAVLLFFLLPLVLALFAGRVFCSSVCPLGAIQDVVLVRPLKVPRWLELGLGLLAYTYLGVAVLFAATGAGYVICRYDPFVAIFRTGGSLLRFLYDPANASVEIAGSAPMFVLGGCLLFIALFVGRPYCRFLCPYGVLLRHLSKVSLGHARITPDECVQCKLCEDACPFGAIRKPTPEEASVPRSEGKVRLGLLLVAVPLLAGAGAWIGHRSSGWLAGAHPTVLRAREVRAEADAGGGGKTDAERLRAEAFLRTGRLPEELYAQEAAVFDQFAVGGTLLGAFLGFVVGGRLVGLAVRRHRTDYEAERGPCVACGRCFAYCPREHLRRARLRGERPDEDAAAGETE
jgi:NAD-dependent dihydropyrimidine dehydrogenase PreA subunit